MQRRFHKQSPSFIKHCADLRKDHKKIAAKHQAEDTKKHKAGMLRIERAALKNPTAAEVEHDRTE